MTGGLHSQRSRLLDQRGFSLLETLIALALFGILALALTGLVQYSVGSSQRNIIRSTAFTVAQGYLEQIKSLEASKLRLSLADPSGTPLPTRSISALSSDVVKDDPLYLEDPSPHADGQNHKQVLVDIKDLNGTETPVYMDMWFDVDMDELDIGNGFLITINFSFRFTGLNARMDSGTVAMIRSE